MKNNGFTLIELLAVITLLAVVAAIATPNVVNMVANGKKEQFISDAKEMISKTKYMQKLSKYEVNFNNTIINKTGCDEIFLNKLGLDLEEDADGNTYDQINSKVKVCIESSKYVYYVITSSIKADGTLGRGITNSLDPNGYVAESILSKDYVKNLE